MATLDIILLIVYALVCIAISYFSARKQDSTDFLISGRKMTLIGFVSSVVASYVGGAAIVAYTAYVYEFGFPAILVFVGTALGFLFFIPYALKIKRTGNKMKFLTLSDWIYHKYDHKTGFISAIILFVVYFGMLLNQFIAGSTILSHISGLSYEMALLLSSVIIILYLFIGGFKSVVKTDIFQYIILFVLFIFLGFIFLKEDQSISYDFVDFSRMDPLMSIVFIAFGIFIIFQSAEYWQRVYAAKNEKVIKKGLVISSVFIIITGFAISIVGLAAYHYLPGIEGNSAFAKGLELLLPDNLISVSLVLLFAAIMSSADTIIFVLSSSMAKDFQSYISANNQSTISDEKLKKRTRIFIVLFSVLGVGLAYFMRDIVSVVIYITAFGFTIIPATFASFHFKISNTAAFMSFLGSALYVIILSIAGWLTAITGVASIVVATLILLIFQIFTKREINNNS